MVSVVVIVFLGIGAYTFKKTYTPGPLSAACPRGESLGGYESHAEFERECLHCHAPVHCLSADRCQECHIEIAEQRAAVEGLHGVLPGTDKCQNCHTEHQGREAVISDVALANVDHGQLTGFELGQHAVDYAGDVMGCEGCHEEGRFAAEAVDCVGCHAEEDAVWVEEHLRAYGETCTRCHDGVDRMADFEHDAVFALVEGHADLECEACHADQTFADPARDCVACHEDPEVHVGQFGLDCSRCHTAVGWTPAALTRHVFPLDHGDEGEIVCETCHVAAYTVYTCDECHPTEEIVDGHAEDDDLAPERCADCHPTGREGEAAGQEMP